MFDYETGIVYAFLMWLFHSIRLIFVLNSQLNRNLNKIGQRLSYMSQRAVRMDESDATKTFASKLGKYLLVVFLGLPFILTSWLYVAYVVFVYAQMMWQTLTAPPSVKEFRWKAKHTDMTFDMLIKETMKITNEDPSTFEAFKQRMIDDLREQGLTPG